MSKQKNIVSVHDKFFRQAMSHQEVARDFFQAHLPPAIQTHLDFSHLLLQKDTYVDEALQTSITDILYEVKWAEQTGYLYLLCEHQRTLDSWMPFRLVKYMVAIMDQHIKAGHTQLPVIYPLVFFNGETTATYPNDIFVLFEDPYNLMRQIWLQPFQVINVMTLPEERLHPHREAALLEFCMKHVAARDLLRYFSDLIALWQNIYIQGNRTYLEASIQYLLHTLDEGMKQELLQHIEQTTYEEVTDPMRTIADALRDEGMQKGLLRGKEEGKKEIAEALLSEGFSLEKVAQLTKLSKEQLSRLRREVVE